MKPGDVRPIAICVIRQEDAIFVFEGRDGVKKETFYRPLGGAIEFGEYSIDTVRREMREEIGAQIHNIRYLGTLENVFHCDGEAGHEIVMVYEADFADPTLYQKTAVTGYEDSGVPFKAVWKPLTCFRDAHEPLYPDGLLQLLAEE